MYSLVIHTISAYRELLIVSTVFAGSCQSSRESQGCDGKFVVTLVCLGKGLRKSPAFRSSPSLHSFMSRQISN